MEKINSFIEIFNKIENTVHSIFTYTLTKHQLNLDEWKCSKWYLDEDNVLIWCTNKNLSEFCEIGPIPISDIINNIWKECIDKIYGSN